MICYTRVGLGYRNCFVNLSICMMFLTGARRVAERLCYVETSETKNPLNFGFSIFNNIQLVITYRWLTIQTKKYNRRKISNWNGQLSTEPVKHDIIQKKKKCAVQRHNYYTILFNGFKFDLFKCPFLYRTR